MSTAAGGRVCVDVHAHLAVRGRDTVDAVLDPGRHLADLDEMGIDIQVIGPMPTHDYAADEQGATRAVHATNRCIAAHCAPAPHRLLGLGTVAMQHPHLAVRQLEYAVQQLVLRGFSVGASVQGRPLGDPAHDPVWRCAEALGAVVFIHPGDGPHPTRWASEALGDTVGQPAETAVALTDLIFTGVLDRFITALPLRPNRQVQQEFAGCAPDVRDIGDAPEPGLIFHAIRAGAAAGREI
ncbi:MAG: amidohydrolase family protein [Dermatophilaceae bacterium]